MRTRAPGESARHDQGSGLLGTALTLIHTGQAPTRSALTACLDVTRATVGAVVAELRELRLIQVDAGTHGGGQGRPSHRLVIDPRGPVVLAAQLHPDGYAVALVGLGGQVVASRHAQGAAAADPARAIAPLAEIGARLLRASGRACVGAAIAVPSAIAEPDGIAVSPLYLDWPTGTKIRDIFAAQLADQGLRAAAGPLAAAAVNDVNAVALAEHRHGAGRGASHLLVIATGHRGVGGALVLRGTLYAGSTGLSMEAGHVSVDPNGRHCPCGNRGCLNVETDAERFMQAAGREPRPGSAVLDQATAILSAEYATDQRVRAAAASLTEALGLGLAGLINVVNPDLVLLGGLHAHLLEAAPDQLRDTVAARSPWGRGAGVPVRACVLDDGGLIGAAELAWQPVLDDPRIVRKGTVHA